MGKNNKLFAEEKIGKLLLRFSIPIIISFLVSELYNMVDTIFVGRTVGGYGIGGLVLVFPIQRIIIALNVMIATGASTSFSRSNGQKDIKKSREILKNGFCLSFLLMTTLTGITYIFSEKILILLGASQKILPYANTYLRIIIFGSTFLSLTTFISNIMISVGNNKVSIISTTLGAITNIILDYILVVKLNYGVKGAAIATTISQIIGFTYAYFNYKKIKKDYKVSTGFELNGKLVKTIILVGLSAFVIEAEDGVLMAVRNNLLANSAGDTGIIVLGVISKVYMFLFITMFGIASAMQPIAAYNVGAKNYGRLKSVMQKTIIYALITSLILWGIMMIFAPQIISLFVQETEIIKESVVAFRIVISALPLVSVYYVSIFYFQALGRAKMSIFLSVGKQIILTIPISILLVNVLNWGAMGIWIAYPISDIISTVVSYILIKEEKQELNVKIEKSLSRNIPLTS